MIILATPPHFSPQHLDYAVEQGKQRLARLVESGQALELVAHTR